MNTSNNPRDSDCAGFYHWPPLWIGTPPVEHGADLTSSLMNAEGFSKDFLCGVRLSVSKQAFFVFDFSQWEPGSSSLAKNPLVNWEERVFTRMRFMNLFLACFYTSLLRVQKTKNTRIDSFPRLFIDLTTYVAAEAFSPNLQRVQFDSRLHSVIRDAEEWHVQFKPLCPTIGENILGDAIDMIDVVASKNFQDVATLAELLLHAFNLLQSGKYEASHVSAWTITERCINDLWNEHLCQLEKQQKAIGAEETFINSERKRKLTSGDFTASIVSEFLSLSGVLSFDKYKLVSHVRQTRNNWLHNLRTITRADAAEAIVLAQFMLRETGMLDIEIPFEMITAIPIAFTHR